MSYITHHSQQPDSKPLRFKTYTLLVIVLLCITLSQVHAQGRLVLNGGFVTVQEGTYLVIDNPSPDAITVQDGGGIITEGDSSYVRWNIGTATGTYTVPWYYAGDSIPLTFTKTEGVGEGHFILSTYHTGWENSLELPAGVTNFLRGSGVDNSGYAVDRFWQLDAQGYTTRPALTDVLFTYRENEYLEPLNTINENVITAQRWNPIAASWVDFSPATSVNTTTNVVTVMEIPEGQLWPWWNLTYRSDRHWIASVSSAWGTNENWSLTPGGPPNASVPTSLDDVYFDEIVNENCDLDVNAEMANILTAVDYKGTITQGTNPITVANNAILLDGTFVGGSADIQIGGELQIVTESFTSTSGTLDVGGNFHHGFGAFIHNNGLVRLSGVNGVTQIVTGNETPRFNNLTIANASAIPGVTLVNNVEVDGILDLGNNVVLDADGPDDTAILTIRSTADDPTRDAAIGILPEGAQIQGNVRIQRFMALEGPGTRIYRYIASPLQNASVADIQNEIPVTGSFTGVSVCPGCVGYSQSMFTYTESLADINLSDGYTDFPLNDNKETLVPGKGYSLYVRGNILSSALWDVNGTVTQGNVTPVELPVSFTASGNVNADGWNLVGNPYASTIDWNAATGWTKDNLDGSIYITDNDGPVTQYATWNGVTGTNGGSRYIALGQAFWVKANGSGTPALTASENTKAPGTQTSFFREIAPKNLLRVSMADGTLKDEAVIHFRSDATADFDSHADAWKMMSTSFNLAAQVGIRKLAINSLPVFGCKSSVNLTVDNAKPGSYALNFESHESFERPTSITLVDNFTNETTDIATTKNYTFIVTTDPASQGGNRFTLHFQTPIDSAIIAQSGNTLTSSYAEGNQWYLDQQPIPGGTTQSIQAAKAGVYSVTVATTEGCTTTSAGRVFSVTGEEEALASAIRVTPNPVAHELYIQVPSAFSHANEATLINSMGQTLGSIPLQQEGAGKTGKLVMSGYPTGAYIIRIIDGAKRYDRKIIKQ